MLKIEVTRQARANYETKSGYQVEIVCRNPLSDENYKKITNALNTIEAVMDPFIDIELARLKKDYEEKKKV